MVEQSIQTVIHNITPADRQAMSRAQARWDEVAKPLGSLGLLEEAVIRAAGATGSDEVEWARKAVAVFCADNGVVAEGVTQTGQETTSAVALAMARQSSCVCRMAKRAGADVFPVDVGMAYPIDHPGIRNLSLGRGTENMAQGPAMTRERAEAALLTGVQVADQLIDRGFTLLAAGEMGIGNTTTSAAITSVLLDVPVSTVTGRGAGLSDQALEHKVEVIEQAIQLNQPDPQDPMDVLSKLGGLDIAAMAGFYLGAARCSTPVLLDGVISCAAALVAVRLCPNAKKVMIASHCSAEPCGVLLLNELGLNPMITAGLCLGEGSGAVAAMPMLDMALSIYQTMSSFHQLGVAPYQHQD